MEKTVVDYLVSILNKEDFAPVLTDEEIEEANQIFREQIIQAAQYEPFLGGLPRNEGIHYFNKTFKTK